MKKILASLAIALSLATFSNQAIADDSSCDQMLPFGYPKVAHRDTTPLCRISYFVEHDNAKKVPLYSAELLTKDRFSGKNKRVNAFKADPSLNTGQRAELDDYDKDYDRGHMSPFEDSKWNSAAALQTFYLSNMVPQNLHLNRGLWRSIENRTRAYATSSKNGIYVITGPIFAAGHKEIGPNKVGVPTSVYKILIDKESRQGVAYLVPNESPLAGVTPETYKTTISEVEKATGINFTPGLKSTSFKTMLGEKFKD